MALVSRIGQLRYYMRAGIASILHSHVSFLMNLPIHILEDGRRVFGVQFVEWVIDSSVALYVLFPYPAGIVHNTEVIYIGKSSAVLPNMSLRTGVF